MLLQTQKQCDDLIAEHGSVSAVARALGIPRSTLRAQITQIRLGTVNKDKAQPLAQPCAEITAILPLIKTGQTLDHRALEPPDPIPNSAVKRRIADGSVGLPHVRVGHRPA